MTDDADLFKRRQELKQQLANGEYKTLVDVILDWVSRLIQKVTHIRRPVSVWYGTTIIFLMTILIGLTALALFGESSNYWKLFESVPLILNVFGLFSAIAATTSMVVANIFVRNLFATLYDCVLDTVESVHTLDDIQRWLADICSKGRVLIASVAGGSIAGLYATFIYSITVGYFVGFGITLLIIMLCIQSTIFLIYLFFVVALSVRIRRFQLKLFAADPSNSEVINRLSSVLNNFVYLVAIYGAVATFGGSSFGVLASFGIAIPFLWIPIVIIFVANQYGLASIIRRAKWRTLNMIQVKVEKLQTEENLTNKDAMDSIVWLLDYHDRIKATHSTALDLRAGLNLLNSLLLPLVAFILANLDKMQALFR